MYRWFLIGITIAGLAGCLTFVVFYSILSGGKWRQTDAGRFMMIGQANLGTLFALILTNQLLGTDWPGRELITAALFFAYVVETWWPLRLLYRSRKRQNHNISNEVIERIGKWG